MKFTDGTTTHIIDDPSLWEGWGAFMSRTDGTYRAYVEERIDGENPITFDGEDYPAHKVMLKYLGGGAYYDRFWKTAGRLALEVRDLLEKDGEVKIYTKKGVLRLTVIEEED